MRMYPAYTVEMVLKEYAIRFFALLNQGYRLRYSEYRVQAQLQLLPHLDKEVRRKWMKELEWAATDPSDILKPSTTASSEDSEAKLKRLFGQ